MKFTIVEYTTSNYAAEDTPQGIANQEQLIAAIKEANKAAIIELFAGKTNNINHCYGEQCALSLAIDSNNLALVKLLIELGADINLIFANGLSVLSRALSALCDEQVPARIEVLRYLLEQGGRLAYRDNKNIHISLFNQLAPVMPFEVFKFVVQIINNFQLQDDHQMLKALCDVENDYERFVYLFDRCTLSDDDVDKLIKNLLDHDIAQSSCYSLQKYPHYFNKTYYFDNSSLNLSQYLIRKNAEKTIKLFHEKKLIDLNHEFSIWCAYTCYVKKQDATVTQTSDRRSIPHNLLMYAITNQCEKSAAVLIDLPEANVNFPGVLYFAAENLSPSLFSKLLSRPEIDINVVGPFESTVKRRYNGNYCSGNERQNLLALLLHPHFDISDFKLYPFSSDNKVLQLQNAYGAAKIRQLLKQPAQDNNDSCLLKVNRIIALCPEVMHNIICDISTHSERYSEETVNQLFTAMLELKVDSTAIREMFGMLAHNVFADKDNPLHYALTLLFLNKSDMTSEDNQRLYACCMLHIDNNPLRDRVDSKISYTQLQKDEKYQALHNKVTIILALVYRNITGNTETYDHETLRAYYQIDPRDQILLTKISYNVYPTLDNFDPNKMDSYVEAVLNQFDAFKNSLQPDPATPRSPGFFGQKRENDSTKVDADKMNDAKSDGNNNNANL